MAYIGNIPAESYSAFQKQDFTTSATTSYTLDHPVANQNELALFINFVRQEPTTAYTASGTSLSLTSATSVGDDMYCVYLGKAVQTVNPPSGSVGSSQLASDAVTSSKLNDDIISGQTALASEPADTDEFLISDAGTLKRIDYSLIKGGGITVADQWRLTADKANVDTSNTIFDSNLERVDTSGQGTIGTAMSESSGVFTFPSTGIYLVEGVVSYGKDSDRAYTGFKIQCTTNNSSYATICQSFGSINVVSSAVTYTNVVASSLVDVTDTSNVKVRFSGSVPGAVTAVGSSSENHTFFTFIRLGDT